MRSFTISDSHQRLLYLIKVTFDRSCIEITIDNGHFAKRITLSVQEGKDVKVHKSVLGDNSVKVDGDIEVDISV